MNYALLTIAIILLCYLFVSRLTKSDPEEYNEFITIDPPRLYLIDKHHDRNTEVSAEYMIRIYNWKVIKLKCNIFGDLHKDDILVINTDKDQKLSREQHVLIRSCKDKSIDGYREFFVQVKNIHRNGSWTGIGGDNSLTRFDKDLLVGTIEKTVELC